jgi:hypothetical protein
VGSGIAPKPFLNPVGLKTTKASHACIDFVSFVALRRQKIRIRTRKMSPLSL